MSKKLVTTIKTDGTETKTEVENDEAARPLEDQPFQDKTVVSVTVTNAN